MIQRYSLLFVLFWLSFLFTGCSDDDMTVRIYDPYHSSDSVVSDTILYTPALKTYAVAFRKAPALTRVDETVSELPKGVVIHIFVYKENESPDQAPCFCKALYTINKWGQLVAVYDKMKLPSGNYDFYAATVCNSTFDQVPLFDPVTGLSDYVYNQRDYLWSELKHVTVGAKSISPLVFKFDRLSSSFVFRFDAEGFLSSDSILEVSLTAPSEKECGWSLASGLINPSLSGDTLVRLKLNGRVASDIRLPHETYENLQLYCRVKESYTEKTYTAAVPLPYGHIYQGGYEYDYRVTLRVDGMVVTQQ